MYSDGQDRSARVRQIPISVEPRQRSSEQTRGTSSRHHNHHQQQQHHASADNGYDRQNQENMWNYRQNQFDNGQRGSDHRQTSPNTSNININYQPQQQHQQQQHSQRNLNQTHQPRSANNSQSHNSRSSEDHDNSSFCQRATSNNQQGGRNDKSPVPRDGSPNADKLVNSPEPIPLPPPPADQQYEARSTTPAASPELDRTQEARPTQQTNSSPMSEQDKILHKISAVKKEITSLLEAISQFKEISEKSKEYRYLDEMLTRCMLNLDNIECGDYVDMRQQRKAANKLVDQTTELLQRKLKINIDIHELFVNMSAQ